jgi:hypothetical protein
MTPFGHGHTGALSSGADGGPATGYTATDHQHINGYFLNLSIFKRIRPVLKGLTGLDI